MRPTIVVDATPIISALIGGFSREVLFNHSFDFITTAYTIQEVTKYIPYISKKAGFSKEFIENLLNLLPLKIHNKKVYENFLPEAKSLIKDKKDVDILALAIANGLPLWSQDKHFENIQRIKLIKTKDFV